MKYFIILISVYLFAFEVDFNDNYNFNIVPNQEAILLVTNKPVNINYSKKIYTNRGIILLNYENADEFVRNDLYFNGQIKNVKIFNLNIDEIRNKIIKKLNKYYKNCRLKKIIFENSNYKIIYFKPTNINITSKVILECH